MLELVRCGKSKVSEEELEATCECVRGVGGVRSILGKVANVDGIDGRESERRLCRSICFEQLA